MKIYIFLATIFCGFYSVNAQQIQWASKTIKFSSDLGGKQFGIKRILGKPDAFPQGGYSENAWTPKNALDGREIIVVGFEKPQTVKQVAVFENLNSGCVMKISVSADGEKFDAVWNRKLNYKTPIYKTTLNSDRAYYFGKKRRKIENIPSVFNPGIEYAILENTATNIMAVKVEFNFALIPGQKQIDAIGISDSETPIKIKVNTIPTFENLPNAESLGFNNNEISNILVSQDGQNFFYSAFVDNKDVIFSSEKQTNGKWLNPKAIPNLSLNEVYNYLEYYSDNLILKGGAEYAKNSTETGFEFLENKNGSFQILKQLKIAAYNNYENSADLTITNDGKTIIMGIETDFTQGGTDLYFTNIKEDGTYGLLQNMGKTINSAADEGMPQLLSDNKTLLFSSYGFSSYGNYDIYVSYRLDDSWKKWSEPINLGSKINSDSFEGSPFYDENTETLYFTRLLEGNSSVNSIKISKSIIMQK